MTPEERAEKWTAPKHDHSHSVFVRCKDCLLFGTPMPGEYQCGNCNSQNTVSYNPPCCVAAEIREAMEDDRAQRCADDLYRGCYQRGLEDAAMIAEMGPGPGKIVYVDGDVRDQSVIATGIKNWIAQRIRARAKEVAK